MRLNRSSSTPWQEIGTWDLYQDSTEVEFLGDSIPKWVKEQLPTLLNEVFEQNTKWLTKRQKAQMYASLGAFEGVRLLKGGGYKYKIVFQEGDSSNYGTIYRKPMTVRKTTQKAPPISKAKCPECRSRNAVRIIYGYPSTETHERVGRGEMVLGGCIIRDSNPKWFCKNCGHSWGRIKS